MLVEELTKQGLRLFIDGKQIIVECDQELTPQHRQLIKNNKQQLLTELAHKQYRYKTTITHDSPTEAIYQYYQRPDESDDDYLGRVIDESLNVLFH